MSLDYRARLRADEGSVGARWPEPQDGQIQVMLLGTVHMAWSDLDDVLDPSRQRELAHLVDQLEAWDPDGVAVERPYEHQDRVNELYDEYRSGQRSYGQETEIDSPHPMIDAVDTECRTEVVQVGFRLADRSGHDHVHAVDHPMHMDAHLDEDLDMAGYDEMKTRAAARLDRWEPSELGDRRVEQWHDSTVLEYLRWENREEQVRANERTQSAVALAGSDQRYLGARLLTGWYERNLRIVENLWRAADQHDLERVLLVMGQGHTHILRQLLTNVPVCCPMSVRPLLLE